MVVHQHSSVMAENLFSGVYTTMQMVLHLVKHTYCTHHRKPPLLQKIPPCQIQLYMTLQQPSLETDSMSLQRFLNS